MAYINNKVNKHKQNKELLRQTESFQSLSLAMRSVSRRGKSPPTTAWFLRLLAWLEGGSAGAMWSCPSWAAPTATKTMKRAMKNENLTPEAILAMPSIRWLKLYNSLVASAFNIIGLNGLCYIVAWPVDFYNSRVVTTKFVFFFFIIHEIIFIKSNN